MMPDNPFDPEDTDWGQRVNSQHQENIARFSRIDTKLEDLDRHIATDVAFHRSVENRVGKLEARLDDSERDRSELHKDIGRVLADTSALVSFSKATAAFKRFLSWVVPIMSAAITAWVTWQVKK